MSSLPSGWIYTALCGQIRESCRVLCSPCLVPCFTNLTSSTFPSCRCLSLHVAFCWTHASRHPRGPHVARYLDQTTSRVAVTCSAPALFIDDKGATTLLGVAGIHVFVDETRFGSASATTV